MLFKCLFLVVIDEVRDSSGILALYAEVEHFEERQILKASFGLSIVLIMPGLWV